MSTTRRLITCWNQRLHDYTIQKKKNVWLFNTGSGSKNYKPSWFSSLPFTIGSQHPRWQGLKPVCISENFKLIFWVPALSHLYITPSLCFPINPLSIQIRVTGPKRQLQQSISFLWMCPNQGSPGQILVSFWVLPKIEPWTESKEEAPWDRGIKKNKPWEYRVVANPCPQNNYYYYNKHLFNV